MSYLNSFFSAMMGIAMLSNSVCFAELNQEDLSATHFNNKAMAEFNVISSSDLQAASGPSQWTQNHLSFKFDASEQTNAIGTFKGYVTFPNQVQYSVTGNIGTGSSPVTLQVGPPSLLGNYVMTFVVTGLSGTIDNNHGPFGTAQNLTNGDHLETSFVVHNVNDQASATFMNRITP